MDLRPAGRLRDDAAGPADHRADAARDPGPHPRADRARDAAGHADAHHRPDADPKRPAHRRAQLSDAQLAAADRLIATFNAIVGRRPGSPHHRAAG
jgi:hypothetical protein